MATDRKGKKVHHLAEARQDLAACGNLAAQRLQHAVAAEQFMQHLMHRAAEPCGKSIPISLMKVAGKVQEKDRLCKHPALQNALEGGQPGAGESGPAGPAPGGSDSGGDDHGHGETRDDGGGHPGCPSASWR